jgi:hypothetical protein
MYKIQIDKTLNELVAQVCHLEPSYWNNSSVYDDSFPDQFDCLGECDENLNSVCRYLSVLVDIYKLFGFETKKVPGNRPDIVVRKAITKAMDLWMAYADSQGPKTDLWKNLGKWKAAAFFSKVFKQQIPPPPKGLEDYPELSNPRFLLPGPFQKWQRKVLSFDKDKLKSFALAILQSKKGAPPMSKGLVEKAKLSTFKLLTTKPQKDDGCYISYNDPWAPEEVQPYFKVSTSPADMFGVIDRKIDQAFLEAQLDRTVDEIFGRKSLTPEMVYKPFSPSTSSMYNYSRKENGAYGKFYEVVTEAGNQAPLMDFDIGYIAVKGDEPTKYGRQLEVQLETLDPNHKVETPGLLFNPTKIQEKWCRAYDELWIAAQDEIPLTKTIGLPEPFKVRVITCGPPATYTVLKPLQKFLWKTLKKLRTFRFIGEPITADAVHEIIGNLEQGETLLSGDYSAATDNFKTWVSNRICERLFFNLKKNNTECSNSFLDEMEALTKRALTGHLIENPVFQKTFDMSYGIGEAEFEILSKIPHLPQENGQLMGSIVSFPFLCIANAAMCRISIEIANGRHYGLDTLPATHNGDDCLLKGRKDRLFDVWNNVTRVAGLVNSVGKTYDSSEFCCMNSVHYDYYEESWEKGGNANPYHERKYPNMGLIYGQDKSGCRGKNLTQLGAVHHDLFRTCPSLLLEKADKLFIKSNRQELERSAPLPWFLPEWAGGIGLCPKSKQAKVSDYDLRTVFHLMKTLKKDVPKYWETYRLLRDEPEWRMYRLAREQLKDYAWLGQQPFTYIEYDGTERNLRREFQSLTSALTTELLFTHPLEDSVKSLKMVNEYTYVDRERNLSHNKIVWRVHANKANKDCTKQFNFEFSRNRPRLEDLSNISYNYGIPCFNTQLAVLGTPFGELLR